MAAAATISSKPIFLNDGKSVKERMDKERATLYNLLDVNCFKLI